MRNDSIERSVNDSILTIADYILQRIDQVKNQQEIDMQMVINQEIKKLERDFPSLSKEEREEAEYDLYYALIKEHNPALFNVKGSLVEIFPMKKEQSFFQIFKDKDTFFGVYTQESKEPHIITPAFSSQEDVLQHTFGTSQFEKFRRNTFFVSQEGHAFSLHENKHFRLNLSKPFKPVNTYETIEETRSTFVKEELERDSKCRNQALCRILDEYHLPSDLVGKTVCIQSIVNNEESIQLTIEESEKQRVLSLPDLAESLVEKVRVTPQMNVLFDEIVMDSRSIAEGFLTFYGFEINKEFQKKQHDFEVLSNEKGSYIGKLNGMGQVKKVSPYFSEEEAGKQLVHLQKHIELEKEKDRLKDKEINPTIELLDLSEKM